MGLIDDWQLRQPRPVREPGAPVEVGVLDAISQATATVVERQNGVWRYVNEEIDIDVSLLKHREVTLGGPEASEVLLWTGMEVRLESTAETRRWQHKDVVVALFDRGAHKASLNVWCPSKLRPPRNRTAAKRLEALGKALRRARSAKLPESGLVRTLRGESALPLALSSLAFDPFESDKKWLTARMPDPMRFRWNEVKALSGDYSVARNPGSRDGWKKGQGPQWSFGLCTNLDTARVEIRDAARRDRRLWELPRRIAGAHHLVQQVEDEILEAAVWQAMAGRVGTGEPVDRVIRLFHDACEAATKRIEGKPRGGAKASRRFTKRLLDSQGVEDDTLE